MPSRTIYDEITRPRSPAQRLARRYGPVLLAVLIPALFLALFRLLFRWEGFVHFFIWEVTTPVKHTIAALCAYLPFSLAEVAWTVGVVGLLAFLCRSLWLVGKSLVYRLQGRRAHPLRRLIRRGLALFSTLLVIYAGYTVTWGINYYGEDFSDLSGLEGRETTPAQLYALTAAFAEKCNQLSGLQVRDEDGLFQGEPETWFQRSHGMYQCLYEEFPFLDLTEAQAKPMFYSRIISILGFTGFYFPFTGESLVNVDAPACLVPATILHELAHQRNIAPEDQCNFLAIIAGLQSDDTEFQYSSALMGYIHTGNALYRADRSLWRQVYDTLNSQVLTDLDYNNAYWAQFQSPAADAAEAVYSSFAKSYGEPDVMKSYGDCVDLLAAYYLPETTK